MDYQEFLEYIVENLPEIMNAQETEGKNSGGSVTDTSEVCYKAHLHTITKNNGVVLDGITILNKGETAGPNVYLNSFYDEYKMGKPISMIMEEIISFHVKAKSEMSIEAVDILNFELVKDRIIVRLVNYDKNKEQLEQCPHRRFLDLAITFRYLASKDAMGLASSLVFNKEFEHWGVDLEELYQLALFNTMREFPWQMDSLIKVVTECYGERLPEELREEFMNDVQELEQIEDRISMYILTNDVGVNGATCILYDNVVKNFAALQDCNVYMLPASVHEVLLIPESMDVECDFLRKMVHDANESAVGLIDLLSDSVYYYDREKDEIIMC